ncbi:unnamed protein product [Effrenium voratum]|nr:unnamed protein product [Effrenium voratum]
MLFDEPMPQPALLASLLVRHFRLWLATLVLAFYSIIAIHADDGPVRWLAAFSCFTLPVIVSSFTTHDPTQRWIDVFTTLAATGWSCLVVGSFAWALGFPGSHLMPCVLCVGPFVHTFTVTSIYSRASAYHVWPGGVLLVRAFWDPPLLFSGYMFDTCCSRRVGRPYFANGTGDGKLSSVIVNEKLLMGGRPLAMHVEELKAANVGLVVNMTAEWPGPAHEYEKQGIKQIRAPTVDTIPPAAQDVERVVQEVKDFLSSQKGAVYIHCKGGRTRAACMMAACLVQIEGMPLSAAVALMRQRRPVVDQSVQGFPFLINMERRGAGGA